MKRVKRKMPDADRIHLSLSNESNWEVFDLANRGIPYGAFAWVEVLEGYIEGLTFKKINLKLA